MFRFANGHVDYRSRYIRTQRYKAQAAARESLFGTYRNPYTDDPRVKGVSRGTANTAVMFHHGKLLAFKEDSPPVVMDPDTLETLDDYYTFGGKLTSLTLHRASEDRFRNRRDDRVRLRGARRGQRRCCGVFIDRQARQAAARDLDQGAVRRNDP